MLNYEKYSYIIKSINVSRRVKMFNNVGYRLQSLSSVFGVIGIISSFVFGVSLISYGAMYLLLGIIIIFLGFLGSWIFSLIIYGFGEMVVNIKVLVERNDESYLEPNERCKKIKKDVKKFVNDSSVKNDDSIDIQCPYCEEEISYTKDELISIKEIKCPECDAVIYEKKENN